jgi:PleD family two-component response regulator
MFGLVLAETTGGVALGTADRIRADLAARRFVPAGASAGVGPVRLTVSCGVAVATSARQTDALIDRALLALARGKRAGGNRTVLLG